MASSSSSSLNAAAAAASIVGDDAEASEEQQQQRQQPIPFPGEPNLYSIPSDLSPTFGRLPVAIQLAVLVASGFLSSLLSAPATNVGIVVSWLLHRRWIRALLVTANESSHGLVVSHALRHVPWKHMVFWLLRAILIATATTTALQERFCPPSRISLDHLVEQYYLPSKLSKFDADTGLHYLEFANGNGKTEIAARQNGYDAVYVNHGFGASSLSWLPALPALVEEFHCEVGMGHDAPGFGFSRRGPNRYTFFDSARLGHRLLTTKGRIGDRLLLGRSCASSDGSSSASSKSPSSVLLVGHSMGAITSLHMATMLPPDCAVDVVLVAPALGLRHHKGTTKMIKNKHDGNETDGSDLQALDPPGSKPRRRLILGGVVSRVARLGQALARYGLRWAVGRRFFWKTGLKLAWGDCRRVTDADALRFQWPAVLEGWEQGLLDFAADQGRIPAPCSEKELVRHVLDRPHARVFVILGGKDPVVSNATIAAFFKDFAGVVCETMDGLGHDPFEEDVPGFIQLVKSMLLPKNEEVQ
jgi:pimeloyl-ACP methyl ester carboxylesterase